jgi:hypothetical protein
MGTPLRCTFRSFEFEASEFVSDFVLRISDLVQRFHAGLWARPTLEGYCRRCGSASSTAGGVVQVPFERVNFIDEVIDAVVQ